MPAWKNTILLSKTHRRAAALSKLSSACGSKDSGASGGLKESKSGSGAGDNSSMSSMYDCRKYGHCLPSNNVTARFETLPHIPTGIFRCTDGEVLGPKADKGTEYPCPEYYSYHHMSYYDFHLILTNCRKPRVETGRKP